MLVAVLTLGVVAILIFATQISSGIFDAIRAQKLAIPTQLTQEEKKAVLDGLPQVEGASSAGDKATLLEDVAAAAPGKPAIADEVQAVPETSGISPSVADPGDKNASAKLKILQSLNTQ